MMKRYLRPVMVAIIALGGMAVTPAHAGDGLESHNRGNKYGWELGRHNPHKSRQDSRRYSRRDWDDRWDNRNDSDWDRHDWERSCASRDDLRRLERQLDQKHARWHRNSRHRNDPRAARDHRDLHAQLDRYYDRMSREYSR